MTEKRPGTRKCIEEMRWTNNLSAQSLLSARWIPYRSNVTESTWKSWLISSQLRCHLTSVEERVILRLGRNFLEWNKHFSYFAISRRIVLARFIMKMSRVIVHLRVKGKNDHFSGIFSGKNMFFRRKILRKKDPWARRNPARASPRPPAGWSQEIPSFYSQGFL